MSFSQFMVSQTLHYVIYLFSGLLIGTDESILANLVFNFFTFFFSALIIALLVRDIPNLVLNVLSVALSFNTFSYLLAYALHIAIPGWKILLLDYLLVICISILGVLTGKRIKLPPSK